LIEAFSPLENGRIEPFAAIQGIVAEAFIACIPTVERVVTLVPTQRVVISATAEKIISATALKSVVAFPCGENIVELIASQIIRLRTAGDILDIADNILSENACFLSVGPAEIDCDRRVVYHNGINALSAIDCVTTMCNFDDFGAGSAIDLVISIPKVDKAIDKSALAKIDIIAIRQYDRALDRARID
jgi:hypothetical protein